MSILNRARSGYHVIKRIIGACVGRNHVLRPEITMKKRHLGTAYGGWVVALESLPRDRAAVVYSVGVGADISFDRALLQAANCNVHGFDPTPKAMAWIAAQTLPERFFFHALGLSDSDGLVDFGMPSREDWDDFSIMRGNSGSTVACEVRTLKSLMAMLDHPMIDILKIDIEGSEYAAIRNFLADGIRPGQLLIEYHYGRDAAPLSDVFESVQLIKNSGYHLFDVAPLGRELSFIHESLIKR